MIKYFSFFIGVAFLLLACAPKPYAKTNQKYKKQAKELASNLRKTPVFVSLSDSMKAPKTWVGTTNFGLRKPNAVIIHHTAQNSCEQTLATFTKKSTQVSAHYVICEDGTLYHMLNDYMRAWHAGSGKWGGQTDINSSSIGIEIDNDGTEPFTEAQLNSLIGLLASLKKTHNIPTANFIAHGDIAPGRKVDPNVLFPWKRLAEAGYGYWYDDTTSIELLPADFNPLYALRIIGYDLSNISNTIRAFRRHFLAAEAEGELTEAEKKVLFVLVKKYL
ncbi:MAG: N-acetylmuramoyl-L-alanine amidase [Ferruginibacter sp.]